RELRDGPAQGGATAAKQLRPLRHARERARVVPRLVEPGAVGRRRSDRPGKGTRARASRRRVRSASELLQLRGARFGTFKLGGSVARIPHGSGAQSRRVAFAENVITCSRPALLNLQ